MKAWTHPPDSTTLWCRGWGQIMLAFLTLNVELLRWWEERLKP